MLLIRILTKQTTGRPADPLQAPEPDLSPLSPLCPASWRPTSISTLLHPLHCQQGTQVTQLVPTSLALQPPRGKAGKVHGILWVEGCGEGRPLGRGTWREGSQMLLGEGGSLYQAGDILTEVGKVRRAFQAQGMAGAKAPRPGRLGPVRRSSVPSLPFPPCSVPGCPLRSVQFSRCNSKS